MRLGLRLQLLLALGSLLVLAFVPLFVAVASLTRATMTGVRESSARALGRAIAGHVMEARRTHEPPALASLLEAQLGQEGVSAIGIYDAEGALVARAVEAGTERMLPEATAPGVERMDALRTDKGSALLIVVPGADRAVSVAVLVRTDPTTVASAPLVGLVALYTGLVALALLVFAYFSMTRLVVRPVVALSHEARRVAEGGRRLEVPAGGARELAELGSSLALMTEKLRADEEAMRAEVAKLELATAELKSAQERLVRSERLASVGRLSAGLAHEIGNPIAAILGFQELLLQGGFDEAESLDFLERMKRETERISKILRDLLDFARPTASSLPPGPLVEPSGSVADAVDDVVALVRPQKAFREVDLVVEVEARLPAIAMVHAQLVQVLLNLLLNAADAAPERAGRVTVRAERVDGARVRIAVEDNGPGIDPSVRSKLFEPFVTTKDVGKGTGLGLAVCRGLVEAAGGTIGVEDGETGGARFVLEVPIVARE